MPLCPVVICPYMCTSDASIRQRAITDDKRIEAQRSLERMGHRSTGRPARRARRPQRACYWPNPPPLKDIDGTERSSSRRQPVLTWSRLQTQGAFAECTRTVSKARHPTTGLTLYQGDLLRCLRLGRLNQVRVYLKKSDTSTCRPAFKRTRTWLSQPGAGESPARTPPAFSWEPRGAGGQRPASPARPRGGAGRAAAARGGRMESGKLRSVSRYAAAPAFPDSQVPHWERVGREGERERGREGEREI